MFRGALRTFPASDTICGVSNQNVGRHSLNKTCRTVGVLNSFRAMVVEHEYKHQKSLNKCILAVNPRRLPDIEEITGSRRRGRPTGWRGRGSRWPPTSTPP